MAGSTKTLLVLLAEAAQLMPVTPREITPSSSTVTCGCKCPRETPRAPGEGQRAPSLTDGSAGHEAYFCIEFIRCWGVASTEPPAGKRTCCHGC